MRLFLLPVSTRRALIYCERAPLPPSKSTYLDRITTKANQTWANWENTPATKAWYAGGWKKQLTLQGNKFLRRIPYQEWGLKTIPALSQRRRDARETMEVKFPGLFVEKERVAGILERLATERQGLHRKRFWWSVVGMPITIPFALIPIIPNIPFFYLVFRAYSHWRALSGSLHLQHILSQNLYTLSPCPTMDALYASGLIHPSRAAAAAAAPPTPEQCERVAETVRREKEGEEVMVLKRWNGKLLADRFGLPEMEVEIERAVEQVEEGLK
ncbi:hypothetical protein K490DRAFT_16475, partial [Saccharata proteae CBS 121410]